MSRVRPQRRSRRAALRGAALAAAVTVLPGCAALSFPSPQPQPSPAPVLQRATPVAAGPSPAAGERSACSDPVGDTTVGDLTDVQLIRADNGLVVRFDLATTPPRWNGLRLAVSLWTTRGAPVREVALRWHDGVVGAYTYDVATVAVRWLTTPVTVTGTTIEADFPTDVLAGLGDRWTWNAMTSLNTEHVDDCPQAGDARGTSPRQAFPAA